MRAGPRNVVALGSLPVALIALAGCTSADPTPPVPTRRSSPPASPTPLAWIATDTGPREFARGPATVAGEGRYRYTVVLHDTAIGIASRFRVCLDDVWAGLPEGVDNGAMPSGTVVYVTLDHDEVRPDGTVYCSH